MLQLTTQVHKKALRTTHAVMQAGDDDTRKAALAGTLVRWLVVIWGHKPSPPKEVDMEEAESVTKDSIACY